MKIPFESVENKIKKWYKNPKIWIIGVILLIFLIIISFTTFILLKQSKTNNETHIHYARINTKVYDGGYELYRLNVLSSRNSKEQYKRLGDFLRVSMFNRSNYEKLLPLCPIIYAMSSVDQSDDWRGMLFGTMKFPNKDLSYPYICYLSVLVADRRHKLGSILLNQFINEMSKSSNPPVTHIQLHTNWENCRAQNLYKRCGFRCNQFTLNGYSKPFEPEYKFGHMIRMELKLSNIKDFENVCQNPQAVEISPEDENDYAKLCNKNIPNNLNQTCTK